MASTPSASRILHIHPKPGLLNKDLVILDSNASTQLYELTGRKSDHWTLQNSSSSQKPVVAAQAAFQGRMFADVTLSGRPPFSMSLGGSFHESGYQFPGITGPLMWSSGAGMSSRLLLRNTQGEWLAKYAVNSMGFSRKARLEVVSGEIGDGALDEIVMTGLVVAELIQRRRKSTSG